jgi:hypothetical protein
MYDVAFLVNYKISPALKVNPPAVNYDTKKFTAKSHLHHLRLNISNWLP